MNRKEALEHMQKGGKIRYHTWWHGKFLHIPGTSKILDQVGEESQSCFEHATEWEDYNSYTNQYVKLEKFGLAVWRSSKKVLFTTPLNPDGSIDHASWAELTDPPEGFYAALMIGWSK
jgi:hypothetical protein